jgi:hypothetical protein
MSTLLSLSWCRRHALGLAHIVIAAALTPPSLFRSSAHQRRAASLMNSQTNAMSSMK